MICSSSSVGPLPAPGAELVAAAEENLGSLGLACDGAQQLVRGPSASVEKVPAAAVGQLGRTSRPRDVPIWATGKQAGASTGGTGRVKVASFHYNLRQKRLRSGVAAYQGLAKPGMARAWQRPLGLSCLPWWLKNLIYSSTPARGFLSAGSCLPARAWLCQCWPDPGRGHWDWLACLSGRRT